PPQVSLALAVAAVGAGAGVVVLAAAVLAGQLGPAEGPAAELARQLRDVVDVGVAVLQDGDQVGRVAEAGVAQASLGLWPGRLRRHLLHQSVLRLPGASIRAGAGVSPPPRPALQKA